jgi:signal transduction histidine kinase
MKPGKSALLIFLVFSLLAVASLGLARHVVGQEESRLLAERSSEAGAELSSSVSSIDAGLHSLGTLAPVPHAADVFPAAATPLVTGLVRTVALVARGGSGFSPVAVVGDATSLAEPLSSEREVLLARAFDRPEMVTGVLHDGYRRRVGFALALPPDLGGLLVYQEEAIDPNDPVLSPASAKLSNMGITVYAAGSATASDLVVSTADSRARSSKHQLHLPVGADQWTLVGQATSPLTGSFPTVVPWLLLVGVLLSGALAAAVLEVLARRRDYALALVEERTAELRDSQALVVESERLAAVGMMAASVGHELRNPLAVLANCLYLVSQRLVREEMIDDRLRRQLATANRELASANLIVSDLVNWSRDFPPNPQPVDLVALVNETLESSPPPNGAVLQWKQPDPAPIALCDREQTKHTVLNLITNAYDALPNNQGTVMLSVTRDDGHVTMTVADDGSGMNDETLSRLFEPFFTTKVRGIGLGLAVTKRLVTANRGTIDVVSGPGAGTRVTVTLPLAEG